MADTLQLLLRRDTASTWQLKNPILLQGEVGIDLTTGNFKIGDGAAPWQQLPYFGIFLGVFAPGAIRKGQFVEGADGFIYEARVSMQATAQPFKGANWRRASWGGSAGSGEGGASSSPLALRDVLQVPAALRNVVVQGSFLYGELQGAQPAGSKSLMEFATRSHSYRFARGWRGASCWIRTEKK